MAARFAFCGVRIIVRLAQPGSKNNTTLLRKQCLKMAYHALQASGELQQSRGELGG